MGVGGQMSFHNFNNFLFLVFYMVVQPKFYISGKFSREEKTPVDY